MNHRCNPDHVFRSCLCLLLILILAGLYGCIHTRKKPEVIGPSLIRLESEEYPRFSDDLFYDGLEQSVYQSLTYYGKMPPDKLYSFGSDQYTAGHLAKSLETFLSFIQSDPSPDELNSFIHDMYNVYRSSGKENTGKVLFTGYYEPRLSGSLEKSDVYRYPVYSQPRDLVSINLRDFLSSDSSCRRIVLGRCTGENTVVPYYERSEIGNGDILSDKADVLAYVDSIVDLFFLEIQGSGIIYLDNGNSVRVHYHTKNGHPYRSIGSYLIRSGKIPREEMSMQRIRLYLKENPEEVTDILNYNPSYVFFKLEEGGPYGCYSVAVTPERSIATDKKEFPACALSFIVTEKPLIDGDGKIVEWIPFGRFVLNQDTGGAIRGPGRADLFKGNGEYAEIAAGHQQHTGTMYFLVLK